MKHISRRSFVHYCALSPLFITSCATNQQALRIAVAANFYNILQYFTPQFEQQLGTKIELITASSGKLYEQILRGLPVDLFLSADAERPMKLEQAGLTIVASRHDYVYGNLALWMPRGYHRQYFFNGQLSHLAIANPTVSPYGMAAKQVLQKWQLWSIYNQKLLYAENVGQVAQWLQVGIEGGLLPLSTIFYFDPPTTTYVSIAQEDYQPIRQQMVILKSSQKLQFAHRCQQLLLAQDTQQTLVQKGFKSITTIYNNKKTSKAINITTLNNNIDQI